MRAVPASDKTLLVGEYVAQKTGCTFDPGMYQAMAILDYDGVFQGGVIFSEFRGHDCQLSTAAETPLAWRDRVIHAVFDYVFNQLGCVRCTALTKKSNKKARAFLEGLGFVLEGRIRRGFDGVRDAIIYGMLREECVYIQELESDRQGGIEEGETGGSDGELVSVPEAPEPDAPQAITEAVDGPTRREEVEFW